ncbi:DUF7619 domain-containing protein [Hymenobacter edaphi]|nr:IPT/TIG domain-containing protein [Hymenobacter edaphi]
MRKPLLLLCLLTAWNAASAQLRSFRLDRVVNTPLDFPQDIEMSPAGVLHVLDRTGLVQLDARGGFLREIRLPSAQSSTSDYSAVVPSGSHVYVLNRRLGFVRQYSLSGDSLRQWGSTGAAAGQFAQPEGATADAAGSLYVADTGNNRVQKLDASGQPQWAYSTGTTTASQPTDVKVGADGNVYVLCKGYQAVKLSPGGQLLATFSLRYTGSITYDETNTLALDAAGNLYVTSTRMSAVQKYSAQGAHLGAFGAGTGSYIGQRPAQTFDAAGNLYVTDGTNQNPSYSTIRVLSPAGTLVRKWGNDRLFGQRMRMDEAGNVYYIDYDYAQPRITKLNAAGQPVATIGGGLGTGDGQFGYLTSFAVDVRGNIITMENNGYTFPMRVQKFDAQGRFLSKFTVPAQVFNSYQPSDVAVDAAGNVYVLDFYGFVRKYSEQGQLLLTFGARGYGVGQLGEPRAIVLDYRGNIFVSDMGGSRVQQFSPGGQLLRAVTSTFPPSGSGGTSGPNDSGLAIDGFGNIYASITGSDFVTMFEAGTNRQVKLPVRANLLCSNQVGTRLVCAKAGNDVLRYYVPTTQLPSNLISGKVFQDANNDCQQQPAEPGLANMVLVAEPGPYYALTDNDGFYSLPVDTGRYTVRQLLATPEPGRDVSQLCATSTGPIGLSSYGNAVSGPDFGNAVSTAPILRVSVTANRRRRCFRNVTTVSYANTGYAPAPGAVVTVALPPQLVFLSASVPHTVDGQGRYVFQVGNLQPLQSGTIVIQDSVRCGDPTMRGLTVCTRAWISPIASRPAPAGWNRASLAVSGAATAGNQVRFVVRNAGSAATTDSLGLRIYQDAQLALTRRLALAAGDSIVLRWPATGPVVRVETDQPAQHPGGRLSSATVEVPGLRVPGQASPAVAAMPPATHEPEAAEDCQPILDSYDPNDKQVLPTGVTAQHYTPTNTPLHYKVRFQNTGNDVAYRVAVVDTLAAGLDLSTLQLEGASHPYRLTVAGRQRPVLTFTFDNILLPDSASDPVRSNGFVQFSLRPLASLPARVRIDNYADIFFDYNEPVRTNTTTNRIYDLPLVVEPGVALSYPAVLASPTVTGFAPAQGRFGTLVTLTGRRFAPAAAGNQVKFNGVPATVLSATATSLTVRVPAGATSGLLSLATTDGATRSTTAFTVYQPPTLTAVAPAEGRPGTLVTLSGAHYAGVAAQDTVLFDGVPARVLQSSATGLQVEVPATAQSGKIRVQTLGGQVESAQPFVVWHPPVVSGLAPGRARLGATVTLTGTNFAAAAARDVVTFSGGSTAPVLQASTTSLLVRVPAGAQSGPVQVLTPGGQASSPTGFVLIPAPVVSAFAPQQGSVGTVVKITGLHFNAENRPDTVYFNGVAAQVLRTSATELEAVVPRGAGSGAILAAGAGGQGRSLTSFTVSALPPAEAVRVYPNPSRGDVGVNWQLADFVVQQVRVYDAVGRLISSQPVPATGADEVVVPLAGRRQGLYLVVLQTSQGPLVKRVTLL